MIVSAPTIMSLALAALLSLSGAQVWAVPDTPTTGAVHVALTGDNAGLGTAGDPLATIQGAFTLAYAQTVGSQKSTDDLWTLFESALEWADNVTLPLGAPTTATLIMGDLNLQDLTADLDLYLRLRSYGYNVELVDDNAVSNGTWGATQAADTAVIVISDSCNSGLANWSNIPALAKPVVNLEALTWDEFGYAADGSTGNGGGVATTITQIAIINGAHPTAGGLVSPATVYNDPYGINYTTTSLLSPGAVAIATIMGDASKTCLYTFDVGAQVTTGTALARAVAFPLFGAIEPGVTPADFYQVQTGARGVIAVAQGTYLYEDSLNLIDNIHIQGGWNLTFDDFSPTTNSAVLDWQNTPLTPAVQATGGDTNWVLEGLTIQNSQHEDKGVGLVVNNSSGEVRSCIFQNIVALQESGGGPTREGAAIYLRGGGNLTISDSVIRDCSATRAGAAFDLDDSGGGGPDTIIADRCLVIDNVAGGGPDGYHCAIESKAANDNVTFRNCVFVGNNTLAGNLGTNGSIMRFTGTVTFQNNTVDANIGRNAGSGGWFINLNGTNAGSQITEFTNNIFSNNSAANTDNTFFRYNTNYVLNTNLLVRNNIFFNNTGGAVNFNSPTGSNMVGINENVNTNPQYVNAAALDYSLQGASPAIDAGRFIGGIVDDYLGRERPRGLGFDIGAFETQAPAVNAIREWMMY
jgi:hypothetical protein